MTTMKRRKNSDDTTRALRRKVDQDPGDRAPMTALAREMLRANDYRGLVALGPAVVPVLRELDEGPESLARRARVSIVRLELSILGRGASFTAKPINTVLPLTLWMSDDRFEHRADEAPEAESVRAYRPSGGFGALIPLRDVVHLGEAAERAYMDAAGGWRVTRLGFDGEGIGGQFVEAWLFGSKINGAYTWNGWASPFMTLDQARRFVQQWNDAFGDEAEGGIQFSITEENGSPVVVYRQDGEQYVSRLETVVGANAPGEPMFDMSHGLTWMEIENAEAES